MKQTCINYPAGDALPLTELGNLQEHSTDYYVEVGNIIPSFLNVEYSSIYLIPRFQVGAKEDLRLMVASDGNFPVELGVDENDYESFQVIITVKMIAQLLY
jgi:hypothetical protein